jgi:inosose dehydratase
MPGILGWRGSRAGSPHRLALSPACWGISSSAGWGHQIDAERVLSEAAAVGEGAITAGPPGFLPDRSDQAKAMLRRLRQQVIAGHVHAILHHHDTRGPELAHVDGHAQWLAAIGAGTLILSAIWEREPANKSPTTLSRGDWAHVLHFIGSVEHVCARHKLKLAVMPQFGSTIQGPEEIERLLVGSEAGLCIDIAHLALAGADTVEVVEEAAGRITHVQLNDIDGDLRRRVRDHSLPYDEAVARGLYKPIGEGVANVKAIAAALRDTNYRGWYTLEQEVRLMSPDDRPLGRISRSLEYVLPLLS